MKVLLELALHSGKVVKREYLLNEIWSQRFVSDEALTRAISTLRKALKAVDSKASYIKTIPKRGYCFTHPLVWEQNASEPEAITENSIAVLAFADMSKNKDYEYFADGISEEIINALTKVPNLLVAARTSSFHFKGQNQDLRNVGQALGVMYILEGSLRIHKDLLRITAQLIRADNGYHSWSETFDGNIHDIFRFQKKIASEIADKLKLQQSHHETDHLPKKQINKDAYDLLLQARHLNDRKYGEQVLTTAIKLLDQAIDISPDFAQLHAEKAHSLSIASTYTIAKNRDRLAQEAADNARKALTLDPSLVLPMTIIAMRQFTQGNVVDAIMIAEEAYALEPENSETVLRLGFFRAITGRTQQALPLLKKAVQIDPVQGRNWQILAMAQLNNGDLELAEINAKRALDLQFHYAHETYCAAAFAMGKPHLAYQRIIAARESLQDTFGDKLGNKEVFELAAQAVFLQDTDARDTFKVMLLKLAASFEYPAISPLAIPILHGLMRLGSAKEFFEVVGSRPPAGSHTVILPLWSEGHPASTIRDHEGFIPFMTQIGFAKAWRKYGWPDRLL